MTEKGKRIFLDNSAKISHCENNLVNLTIDGKTYERLEPRRLFPVNNADEYITLLSPENKEIAIVRRLGDIDPESREALLFSLDDFYFVPYITKINSITEKNGKIHWSCETERGHKEFDIRNRNHDIKVYRDGRVRVRDSDDNRYLIKDYKALDKHSRMQLIADL